METYAERELEREKKKLIQKIRFRLSFSLFRITEHTYSRSNNNDDQNLSQKNGFLLIPIELSNFRTQQYTITHHHKMKTHGQNVVR